jgi:hypothetical protein
MTRLRRMRDRIRRGEDDVDPGERREEFRRRR